MKIAKLIFMVLMVPFLIAWTFRTPAGIVITANSRTIVQYEQHWKLDWDGIDWGFIDDLFFSMKEYYGDEMAEVPSKGLKVNVVPFTNCRPSYPGMEMRTPWGCYEGVYDPDYRTIYVHLGDDSGQGPNAWCRTALGHEMSHYFLFTVQHECSWEPAGCGKYFPSEQILNLCN